MRRLYDLQYTSQVWSGVGWTKCNFLISHLFIYIYLFFHINELVNLKTPITKNIIFKIVITVYYRSIVILERAVVKFLQAYLSQHSQLELA